MNPLRLPLLLVVLAPAAAAQEPPADERLWTDRESPVELPLPEEDDSFVFAIFGDRTGGPPEGVKILAQAVEEVNLVQPDLVMTVGDLIEGYNQTAEWMRQMREFRGIMDGLVCPWFPVAGNHDVYWRGPDRPEGEHDASYEAHFGPLWYAFRHKDCWFIALYTDEGNPQTGEKNFGKPECQRMSPEQFAFLDDTLEIAKGARHVFVFLHHPRWHGGRYGSDWERVHRRLVAAGNVSAVFAGHIHRMVYDGVRDGIEYFTLATTGGHQGGDAAEAGFLHHWNLVTVRDDRLGVVTFPVGGAVDPRAVTHELSDAVIALERSFWPEYEEIPTIDNEGVVEGKYHAMLTNPIDRAIELDVNFGSRDARWFFFPDHGHAIVEPGQTIVFEVRAVRERGPLDRSVHLPVASIQADVLGAEGRVSLPVRTFPAPVEARLRVPGRPSRETALRFDGKSDHLRVEHGDLDIPDGPLTLECWMRADRFRDRVGLATKTEGSEFGLFVSQGVPEFILHVDGAYATAKTDSAILAPDRWHHIAGVFDGAEVRLYVDGSKVAAAPASGTRTRRGVPLLIGADVDAAGNAVDLFAGAIDELRLSRSARYAGEQFDLTGRHEPDADTLLLLHLDARVGPWVFDHSPRPVHALRKGDPLPEPVEGR